MAAMSTRLAGGALLGLGLWVAGPAGAQQAYPRSNPHNSQRGTFERMLAYKGMESQQPSGQAPPLRLDPSQPPPYPGLPELPAAPPIAPPGSPRAPQIGEVPPPVAPTAPEPSLPAEAPPPGAVPPAPALPPEAALPPGPSPAF